MTDAKESEKLRELEAIARGNGYWNHIEPFVEALTRERDAAVDRGLELQAQLMTMLVQRDEARVVTDAMVGRASLALWDRYGDYIAATVEDNDIRAMLTAALTQGDA
jgi:uncharacterized protein YqcC (DUF446 family)